MLILHKLSIDPWLSSKCTNQFNCPRRTIKTALKSIVERAIMGEHRKGGVGGQGSLASDEILVNQGTSTFAVEPKQTWLSLRQGRVLRKWSSIPLFNVESRVKYCQILVHNRQISVQKGLILTQNMLKLPLYVPAHI